MRLTTTWAIISAIAWFLLNILASASAPDHLGDPEFAAKVATASGLQSIGNLFLIAAIILILVTAYKNLFSKEAVRVDGDWNQASHGANIVTRTSGTVTVSSHYQPQTQDYSQINAEQISSLNTIKSFLQRTDSEEARRALGIFDHAEKELQKKEAMDEDRFLGFLSRAITIVEKIAPAVGPIADSIGKLKKLL